MRLIASEAALDVLVALGQAPEARLTDLAQATGLGLSTTQRALEVLTSDGLALRGDGVRYRAAETLPARVAADLALVTRPIDLLARIVGSANEGVELIGTAASRLVVVAGRSATPDQRLRARRALDVVARRSGLDLVERQHDELRAHRADFAEERSALEAGAVFHGNLETAYPRVRAARAPGVPIGRLNSALRMPPQRRLRQIARQYGVRRLDVFGSAVRDDFRPDSDVDVVAELLPGASHRGLADLEDALERLFDRDVDVVLSDQLRERVRDVVERERVPLFG